MALTTRARHAAVTSVVSIETRRRSMLSRRQTSDTLKPEEALAAPADLRNPPPLKREDPLFQRRRVRRSGSRSSSHEGRVGRDRKIDNNHWTDRCFEWHTSPVARVKKPPTKTFHGQPERKEIL